MKKKDKLEDLFKKQKLLCRECEKLMTFVSLGGDVFSMFFSTGAYYCNNKKCKRFGDLTVGGVKEK